MNIIRRALRLLKKRGVAGTADFIVTLSEEIFFDVRYGTDTFGNVKLNMLDITSDNKAKGVDYEPTRIRPFKKMLRAVEFPQEPVFVDFGCGKGRALLAACDHGFRRIVGVEFSAELCDIAKKNLALYTHKRRITADASIVHSDVVDYAIQDDENVFYMFNPFNEEVLDQVVRNICESLNRNFREVRIIYHNPLSRHVIERRELFTVCWEHTFSGHHFLVYRNVLPGREDSDRSGGGLSLLRKS
jgi:SAM-dependent methyltransferase